MKINIITLFPEMFNGAFSESIIKRAIAKEVVNIKLVNLRDFATDKRKTVDDTPYGGGAGMVLKPEVMDSALQSIVEKDGGIHHIVLLTPQGKRYNQAQAQKLAKYDNLILICGHYEGFDERIREHMVDEQISIGDFVLSGGEIPAMAIVDSVVRLLPNALGGEQSTEEESFSIEHDGKKLIEYPHYTKPVEYKGWKVPEILLSGNHAKIKKWRLNEAIKRTR
jgi:tRNA (guanine37-N1)-methyltransferase